MYPVVCNLFIFCQLFLYCFTNDSAIDFIISRKIYRWITPYLVGFHSIFSGDPYQILQQDVLIFIISLLFLFYVMHEKPFILGISHDFYIIIYECFIQSKIIKVYIYLLCLSEAYLYIYYK